MNFVDEAVIGEHARDALGVDAGREQLGERGCDAFQHTAVAHEVEVGVAGETGARQDALGGLHILPRQAQSVGEAEPALNAAFVFADAVMIEIAVAPFKSQLRAPSSWTSARYLCAEWWPDSSSG